MITRSKADSASGSGFTLIELLVVMSILALLAGLAFVGLPAIMRRGESTVVQTLLDNLDASLQAYRSRAGRGGGDFPPTSLQGFPGVGQGFTLENCGIEAVVLCLNRRGTAEPLDVEGMKGIELGNLDKDFTEARLTVWEAKDLFELVDPWGTPLVYFHSRDYDRVKSDGLGRVMLRNGSITDAEPWRNPTTKSWYNARRFQIISAGPDGMFNTDDDLTNFQH